MTLPILKHLYRRYIYDAQRRGKEFNLSLDIFETLISSPCFYCNTPPVQVYCQKSAGYKVPTLVYSGIDRYDNDRGYVPGNVVPCCASCNKSKKDREATYMFDRIAALYELGRKRFSKV